MFQHLLKATALGQGSTEAPCGEQGFNLFSGPNVPLSSDLGVPIAVGSSYFLGVGGIPASVSETTVVTPDSHGNFLGG